MSLYLQLSDVGLDPARVFRVRGGSIDRSAIHITLEDGTIAFTKDVMGKITGAFFEGDGEILVPPPDEVERRSMTLFTGMAILEERFGSAYFRFNDNTAAELQPSLRAPEDALQFIARCNEAARIQAQSDAMRLLASFSTLLPIDGKDQEPSVRPFKADDRMLHARLQGNTLGVFDVIYDSTAEEQIGVGQSKPAENGTVYYDVWTSFSPDKFRAKPHARSEQPEEPGSGASTRSNAFLSRDYVIDAHVSPPKELNATVTLRLQVTEPQTRFLAFELSRYLKLQSVTWKGKPVEFIQNPAIEGTRIARSGNDRIAVVLPEPVQREQEVSLTFVYGGEVLAEAGRGLLYVGARGTWYPNRGISMSNFDITFHYPQGWTLLATGRPQTATPIPGAHSQSSTTEQVSHWKSERPIPIAGFDLGKYVEAATQAGNVPVEAYATTGVERDFPSPPSPALSPVPHLDQRRLAPSLAIEPLPPSPARNAMVVAETTAQAIGYYSDWFGPFPYGQLALVQFPGTESQGWPGLVFLSSYAFLTSEERRELHMNATQELIDQLVPAHEAAHQWWGDLVTWSTYHDQWFSEGLANYCALMILEKKDPAAFQQIMESYRLALVTKDKNGNLPKDAGPVTMGVRLLSSHSPEGYEAISYGRGTWLFHMLRSMMRDAATLNVPRNSPRTLQEEPFVRSLRKVRERYQGKAITTRELLNVFAEDLPPSLRYEGKSSLDWFVDSWVNGTSLPKLELQSVKFSSRANAVIVTGVIRQKDLADNLVTSVPIYAVKSEKNSVLLGRVFADGPETPFRFSAPPGTHRLLLDPNKTVLTSPK